MGASREEALERIRLVLLVNDVSLRGLIPGELAKGLKILAAGGDVDYVGATGVEFNAIGEVQGSYKELEVKPGFAVVQTY